VTLTIKDLEAPPTADNPNVVSGLWTVLLAASRHRQRARREHVVVRTGDHNGYRPEGRCAIQ
jgi:hypothetical protein